MKYKFIKIKFLEKQLYEDFITSFVFLKSLDHFLYRDDSIKLQEEVSSSYAENNSLAIYQGQLLVGYIPIYGNGITQGFFKFPTELFLNENINEIDVLNELAEVRPCSLTLEVFADELKTVVPVRKNVIASTNLLRAEIDFKRDLRKSYRSLVNWGRNNLDIQVFEKSNFTEASFNIIKQYYLDVSAMQEKDRRWDHMRNMFLSETAFAVTGYLDGTLVSLTIIEYGRKIGYYSMGAYDKVMMTNSVPVSFFVLYHSICIAKSKGLENLVLGYLDSNEEDKKLLNIFNFKKGFSESVNEKNVYHINC